MTTPAQEAETVRIESLDCETNREIDALWRAVEGIRRCPQSILDKMLAAYKREQLGCNRWPVVVPDNPENDARVS